MKIKKKKMNKLGEITSSMLVKIILLIIGFGILLFIYYQVVWTGQVNKEVCHESVIMRGTVPSIAQSYVPLKCQTNKVCVRGKKLIGKGDCSKDLGVSKSINYIDVKTNEQVEKAISQEIVDCWSMMGKGKLSVFSQFFADTYGVGTVYPTCVICSRIAFNENTLKEEGIDLSKINIRSYMQTHKIPGEEKSYYEYLAGEGGKINTEGVGGSVSIKSIEEKDGEAIISEGQGETVDLTKTSEDVPDDAQLAVIFMQISSPTHGGVVKNTIATMVGTELVGGYIFGVKFITGSIKLASKGGVYTLAALAIAGIYQQGSVAYNRAVTAGYCGDVSIGSEARDGCSVVRTVNYDEKNIRQYCSVIESIS